jgi:DNA repair protein RecN (Recombination protein N)
MLRHLSIRDVVLIDRAEIDFGPGLTALTGETGAGKSILLDAFGLTLGARSDAGQIRDGAERATVTATFDASVTADLAPLLDEHDLDLDPGEDLILRRSVGRDGRSRGFVNDQPVSIGLLRRIGDALVEIHGQFERFSLAEAAIQRQALDAFAGLDRDAREAAARFREWREAVAARTAEAAALGASESEAAELRAALDELDGLSPAVGEAGELASRRQLLQNAGRLLETLNEATEALSGDPSAETLLQRAARVLERDDAMAGGRLAPVISAIDKSAAELAEAILALNSVAHDLDTDTGDIERVEERYFAINTLARKHRVDPDALPRLRDELAARLDAIENRDARLDSLAQAAETARRAYSEAAEALSRRRTAAAKDLDKQVVAELPPLKLENARFQTRIERLGEDDWSEHGIDAVFFEVTTNPGSTPGPLGKIASGGELSRFMLALKVVLAGTSGAATIVFDEVDTGVGGATAAAVGQRLAELAGAADSQQILVVTHSPQVAAAAGSHLRVEKQSRKSGDSARTTTDVIRLDGTERREEIARMLSGTRITDEARAAADKLMLNDDTPVRASA